MIIPHIRFSTNRNACIFYIVFQNSNYTNVCKTTVIQALITYDIVILYLKTVLITNVVINK